MDGREYRAKVRLSDASDRTLADVGARCEQVPSGSLPWLLEQGLIERADADDTGVTREEE